MGTLWANIRMMMGVSVQCLSCGVFIYKGTKFNMRKECIQGEDYLGIKIHRFYFRCPRCASTITFKTDPKYGAYLVEHGGITVSDLSRLDQFTSTVDKTHNCIENDISQDIEHGRIIRNERDSIGVETI